MPNLIDQGLVSTCHGSSYSIMWRHNGRDSVSNHQPHDCLLNRLFRRRSKKTSKLRVTGLCAGNSPVTGEFPAQMTSNAENVPFDDVIMPCQFLFMVCDASYKQGKMGWRLKFIPQFPPETHSEWVKTTSQNVKQKPWHLHRYFPSLCISDSLSENFPDSKVHGAHMGPT